MIKRSRVNEEFTNTVTAAVGLVLSIPGTFYLFQVLREADASFSVALIYSLSLVALFAASTFYHWATEPSKKSLLRKADHICIFLLIAGTYTPFCMTALPGSIGRPLCVTMWTLAAAGSLATVFLFRWFRPISPLLYLAISWLGLTAYEGLRTGLSDEVLRLVMVGAFSYTFGVVFFAWRRLPHHHAVWHIFVLGGAGCHYWAVLKLLS